MKEDAARPRYLFVATGLILMALASGFFGFLSVASSPYKGYPEPEQIVVVERGGTVQAIARNLASKGVIRSAVLFEWYIRLIGQAQWLQAGAYRFEGAVDLFSVARTLRLGLVHHRKFTVPEGLTLKEIAARLHEGGFGSEDGLLQALQQTDWIAEWDPEAGSNLEGYLFPDTYFFTLHMNEAEIVQTIVGAFRKAWSPEHSERARELGFSVREVVTLASLIEAETGLAEERALVSAVFHNRLRRNMKLACDPTVIYAVSLVKEFDGIIHRSDLEIDSPYNTYLYPGLPPGPIGNPGLASIEAALYPAQSDYLYFVSRNDGGHHFSTSYNEHSRAVAQYQR